MMLPYLDILDELLAAGLRHMGDGFHDAQWRYLLSVQRPDGGFSGRRGETDLYYSDFGVRCLVLLVESQAKQSNDASKGAEAFRRAAVYASCCVPPVDVTECFSLLSLSRLLLRRGCEVLLDRDCLLAKLEAQRLETGGFSRRPSDGRLSAYQTFLALLCYQVLEVDPPKPRETGQALASLQQGDGGFAETTGQRQGQTNATAAVLAGLTMLDYANDSVAAQAVRFLADQQISEGGLRAHGEAMEADLLSTFTGLLTLALGKELERVNLPRLGSFLRGCARDGGGFAGGLADADADVEYTYYGLATAALLRNATLSDAG